MLKTDTLNPFFPIQFSILLLLLLLGRHTQLTLYNASHSPTPVFLSCVSLHSVSKVCAPLERSSSIPTLAKSCHTVCIQVVFGLPFGRFTFLRCSLRAFLAGVSGCKRMRCPSHVSLPSLIFFTPWFTFQSGIELAVDSISLPVNS